MEKNEVQVRKMLDDIVKEGAYQSGHVIFFRNLYDQGYRDAQEDIKSALGVQDCTHD